MSKIKAAILGASGYTGSELLRFLVNHPKVEITYLTADRSAGKRLDEVLPVFKDIIDLKLHPLDLDKIPRNINFAFTALPHGTSANIVKHLYEKGIKVVDLGADFRISHRIYKKWYGKHPCPELIDKAVYGLPELHRAKIKRAKIIANPGCYPTSSTLPLAPLLKNNLIKQNTIIIDSKSGVSGAGRSAALDYNFCEVNEGLKAYKIGEHRHMPEITEVLSKYSGKRVSLNFSPHLIPIDRGILSTVYVDLKKKIDTSDLLSVYSKFYRREKFVRVMPEGVYPSTHQVRGSNFCDIGCKVIEGQNKAIIVSVIDNLVKGASGQAVQNMNLMMGYPEDMGLNLAPVFP
ncbi:MAG: N-acetyl-gamma-glutamyl-phosphate reductase [Candidatus Dadabacteria bacterium]|nr:N-acetyl-gamma-glutamyl-phosphate reductase [Candidatus Dadabacteria bacterium]NIS07731.1 N-acetyl-gamma-glutamyl-phosphate reductase [Candidatus Dadabacteria bacterium]NIV42336.1 N-acetyl-gamma-glutamyl-phosphate reductase [Candidatus Dadabacteria bacterium]NIY21372.1 N-acetyl-gamma-glutamyl-phosphate reductase [Candidatus Dadabacteria bacterium]